MINNLYCNNRAIYRLSMRVFAILSKLNAYITLLFLICFSYLSQAEVLKQVPLNEDDIILLDVAIGRNTLASSIDAYVYNNREMIAVDPLFDSLKLRYQILDNKLSLWKKDTLYEFDLVEHNNSETDITNEDGQGVWATDGFYFYLEISLFAQIFDVAFDVSLTQLLVTIDNAIPTGRNAIKPDYLFPVQQLALQTERRQMDKFYNPTSLEIQQHAITIADQYRIFTPPNGRVNLAADLDDHNFTGSAQLVSDLLYHSANLTLFKSDNTDTAASLSFSRFKSSPDDRILGLFDSYRFGDVSGVSNNLTTASNSGIGVGFQRAPDGYRRKNLETTIEEIAPPGWDAELFHNGVFLSSGVVPNDGRLIYENIPLYFGVNEFEIRLYGPYGEEEVIPNRINVRQNPLLEGEMAYSLNALDKNHRIFNDDSDEPYGLTNFGGSFSYGVNDRWQLGASFASLDEGEQQFLSIKNALSFNNLLVENDLSVNQDGSYAQLTSLTGSLFYRDSYSIIFETADNYASDTIEALNDKIIRFGANYSLPTSFVLTRFSADYRKTNDVTSYSFSNLLSKQLWGLSVNHTINYNWSKLNVNEGVSSPVESFAGSLNASGRISEFLISASLNYDPERSDPILESSTFNIRTRIKDPYENSHYLQAQYFPLNDNGQRWRLRHNVSWQHDDFYLTFATSYDSKDEWSVDLAIRFFLSYDHRNNQFLMDKELSVGSATLDVHSYLDRQVNGVPDVLDYDLADVTFSGNQRWAKFASNENGRTILPGVMANQAFPFSASWQEGSATVNNDYVVYTHPGAYVDVNMPFFLITDLTGFVIRVQGQSEVGLRNVKVILLGFDGKVLETTETDADGYYEFLSLAPDNYVVKVAPDYLREKGMTGDVVGINVVASGRGGFVELPSINLQRQVNENEFGAEEIQPFILDENNVDALVWDEDENIGRNYFTLPRKNKGKLTAAYSLTQGMPANTSENAEEIELTTQSPQQRQDENIVLSPVSKFSSPTPEITNDGVRVKPKESPTKFLPQIKFRQLTAVQNQAPPSIVEVNNGVPLEQTETTDNTELNKGWLIQFSANKNAVNRQNEINQFSAIGPLYLVEKNTLAGERLFCIVSDIFMTKESAVAALEKAGLNGWVADTSQYKNQVRLN